MSALSQPQSAWTSPQEYLARERKAEYKSEYLRGEIFAMSGVSREHNLIAGNVFGEIRRQFRGRACEVYMSDVRVKVEDSGLYTYPDVVAVCEEPQFEDDEVDTLLNPTLIVEVLSKSTEGYDRGAKFEHYRKLTSLREYVLIAQDKPHVEHFIRQEGGMWLLWETGDLEVVVRLPAVKAELTVAEIYEKVVFPVPDQTGNGQPEQGRTAGVTAPGE
jgi:Uma2 family endonuclease